MLTEASQSDADLLRDFTQNQSQLAFSNLVTRYSDLVYAAACRQITDPATAEDITQAAFLLLAKKSATIKPDRLPAWLLTTTRLCAKQAIRTQSRRTRHEQEAAMTKPESIAPPEPHDPMIKAMLDEALSHLPSSTCTAIAMRHLQNRPVNEIAATIGVSPDAAQKILARGLVKLRNILTRKGVTLPSIAVLTTALLHESGQRAPASLVITPTTSTSPSLALAKSASNIMHWTTIKLTTVAIAALILLATAGSFAIARMLAQSTAAQTISQSAPIKTSSDPATPTSVAPFDSPFLQLAGCRIIQHIPLKLSVQPTPTTTISAYARQFTEVEWTAEPGLVPAGFTITVTTSTGESHTVSADKSATLRPIPEMLSLPGEYELRLTALAADSKPLATAGAHVIIQPLPLTDILIRDIQPDRVDKYCDIIQMMNDTGGFVRHESSHNLESLSVRTMCDADGHFLNFTPGRPKKIQFGTETSIAYTCDFLDPIPPGDAILWSNSGTWSHTDAAHENETSLGNGVYQHAVQTFPNFNVPVRRIELYRLPTGAELLESAPNLQTRSVAGQTQIYEEAIVPAGGDYRVEFRYRVGMR